MRAGPVPALTRRCSLAFQPMCSPEKLTPSSGGDEVEGKHVRNRAALGVCEARSVAGKVVAGLLAPRAGGDGRGCFDSVSWPPFSHRFPAVPNPTDPVQERRPGAGVGRPCMQCWGCTCRQWEVPALSPGVGSFRTFNPRRTRSQGEKRL